MKKEILDYIGIGLGPFNISFAALSSKTKLKGMFFDQKKEFNWHPGMMISETHLQVPFLADFVTLADPTNRLSFLNYLKENNRIYKFYIKENFFVLRKEYNHYCRWVLNQLENCYFNHKVTKIEKNGELYQVEVKNKLTNCSEKYLSKRIILGVGTVPHIPSFAQSVDIDRLSHTSSYLYDKKRIEECKDITIVGGGQSAAEIFIDLLRNIDEKKYTLNWITRSERFSPLEYSKLTLEMTSPEYVDFFYNLPQQKKDDLIKEHKLLYKGINYDLINEIYDLMYEKTVGESSLNVNIIPCTELSRITENKSLKLSLKHLQTEEEVKLETDYVIMATGYTAKLPGFIDVLKNEIQWDDKGRYAVNRNYSIDMNNTIFVQNAELHTHGFVTPDLGMVPYKNSLIINEMLGENFYNVERQIAFQQFGVVKNQKNLKDSNPVLEFA